MEQNKLLEEMKAEINEMWGIDTHEHIRRLATLQKDEQNIYSSFKHSIFNFELVSAGMDMSFWAEDSKDPKEAWSTIRLFLDRVRNGNFYRTLVLAYKDLFDFQYNEIRDDNWEELSNRINNAYKSDNWYYDVIKNKLKKEITFIDIFWDPWSFDLDRSLFVPVQRVEYFLFARSKKFLEALTIAAVTAEEVVKKLGLDWSEYKTIDDFEDLLDIALKKVVDEGCPCIKLAVSYNRGLNFEKVSKDIAGPIFQKKDMDITAEDTKQVEDYICHALIKKCIKYNLPIQIHTGIQGGVTSKLRNADPLDLNDLFFLYPDAKFILFHMGCPYSTEVALLAKTFPNVYLDACWMAYYLYGSTYKSRLKEWLTLVPINKIMAGGDCENVERMYAAMTLLKKQLAEILTECIEYGLYDKELSLKIAKDILYNNALEIFPSLKSQLKKVKK